MKAKRFLYLIFVVCLSLFLFACASGKKEQKAASDDFAFNDDGNTVNVDENVSKDLDTFPGDEVAVESEDDVTVEATPSLPGESEVYDESIGNTPAQPLKRAQPKIVVNKPYSRSKVGYPEYNLPPGPKASGGTYIVKKGDTLWAISRRYGVPVRSLAKANGMSVNVPIKIGQKLVIPDVKGKVIYSPYKSGKNYVVKKGDSYYKIARKFGLNYKKLMNYNNATSSQLKVGQVIKIP